MPLINFKLKHPDNIAPWGTPPVTRMHWFALTDSLYWLDLNKAILFELTDEVAAHWKIDGDKYVDYYLVRLMEDWESIFESIAEPIPADFYTIAKDYKSLYSFYETAQSWLENLSDNPEIDTDTYYDRYDNIIEWIYSRTLSTMHLSHGPGINFFRHDNKLAIVWNADQVIEGIPIWTAQNGEIETDYETFISDMQDFGTRFFKAMDAQVQIAITKDWGTIDLDKARLIEEHRERKATFDKSVSILKEGSGKRTDWNLVTALMKEMAAFTNE